MVWLVFIELVTRLEVRLFECVEWIHFDWAFVHPTGLVRARLKFYTLMMLNSNSERCKVALMNYGFATESIPLRLENFNISIGEIIDWSLPNSHNAIIMLISEMQVLEYSRRWEKKMKWSTEWQYGSSLMYQSVLVRRGDSNFSGDSNVPLMRRSHEHLSLCWTSLFCGSKAEIIISIFYFDVHFFKGMYPTQLMNWWFAFQILLYPS